MKVAFQTLGCKLNQFEGMAMAEEARLGGMEVVPFGEGADIYVVNTCTVTQSADSRCRQLIRRAARERPGALIVAVGCYAERDPGALAALPGVRLVLGNREKRRFASRLAGLAGILPAAETPAAAEDGFPVLGSFGGRARALVKIQDGCGNRCAYCVVWRVRGPNRSQGEERIVAQVAGLARAGWREVVLSGVHLGSWGRDLVPARSLAGLLERLTAGEGGPRLRLSSIEPDEFDGRLIEVIARHETICRHFHVPLQSGSDAVLERMKRNYSAEDYRRLVEAIAGAMPGCAIGADVIVGFPGEREEDFRATLDLAAGLPLAYLHVFNFSRRPGTAAADMEGQVPAPVREERSRRLRALGLEKALAFRRSFVGRELACLVEMRRDRVSGLLKGVSDNYLKVLFQGPDDRFGREVPVVVERLEGKELYGRMGE